jgi:hypothetical protein
MRKYEEKQKETRVGSEGKQGVTGAGSDWDHQDNQQEDVLRKGNPDGFAYQTALKNFILGTGQTPHR